MLGGTRAIALPTSAAEYNAIANSACHYTKPQSAPTALRYVGWDSRFFRTARVIVIILFRSCCDTVTTIFALFRDYATCERALSRAHRSARSHAFVASQLLSIT